MPTVKLTHTAYITQQTNRVRGILLGELTAAGLTPAQVKALCVQRGITISDADYTAIAAALVADGTIEIV